VTLSSPPAIQVSGLEVRLPVSLDEGAAGPVVRRLRLRLSGAALARLLAPAGVKLRLVPGGGVLNASVGIFSVTADLVASVTGEGRLRVEATALRVGGFLPLPPTLVGGALSKAEVLPGVRAVPPRALELELAALLEHFLRPFKGRVEARIRRLRVTGEFLEAECEPADGDDGTETE
jgi:hypothetical protein